MTHSGKHFSLLLSYLLKRSLFERVFTSKRGIRRLLEQTDERGNNVFRHLFHLFLEIVSPSILT